MKVQTLVQSIAILMLVSACSKAKFDQNSEAGSQAGSLGVVKNGAVEQPLDTVEGTIQQVAESETEDEQEIENEIAETAELNAIFDDRCMRFAEGKFEEGSMSLLPALQQRASLRKVRQKRVLVRAVSLSLDDIRGAVYAMFQTARPVNKLRGPLCFVGMGLNNAMAQGEIINHRGPISIKSVAMDLIEKTRGVMVIRDGEVDVIDDHRGTIRLINTKVGLLRKFRGRLILEGSSVVETQDDVRLN
jgi:hypothetical protein